MYNRVLNIFLIGFFLFFALLAVAIINPWQQFLSINVTNSLPRGIYFVVAAEDIKSDDLLLFRLSPEETNFMKKRGYLPDFVPGKFIKPVFGTPGDFLCSSGDTLTLNGKVGIKLKHQDSSSRELVPWSECRELNVNEYFMAIREFDKSYDSRYFGPIKSEQIIGQAKPLLIID